MIEVTIKIHNNNGWHVNEIVLQHEYDFQTMADMQSAIDVAENGDIIHIYR